MKLTFARLVPVLCFAAVALANPFAHADSLHFEGATAQSGGEYIYPYTFSVNDSSTTTDLMCLDLNRYITAGETWSVTPTAITASMPNATQYQQEAYIYSQLGQGTYSDSDVQWAAWDIFDPADVQSNAAFTTNASQLVKSASLAVAGGLPSSFYSNYVVYIPDGNQAGWTDGTPQDFIGASPVPEPSSLMLFGSGLLGLAGMVRRKVRRS